ncbi:carbonic anhydrase [Chytridium lagenaria]|nr:carbonic anhydrase [Chytridium lagenaria]
MSRGWIEPVSFFCRQTHGDTLSELLENNRIWSAKLRRDNPALLARLASEQTPEILWIGCSDSRVPAESIIGVGPGDLFVHRNIANVVCHTDLSMLSVLQYAVDVLRVKHCGGCLAAMSDKQYGLIDNWLRNIKDVYSANKHVLDQIEDKSERAHMLIELNVAKSVHNICNTTVVQNAWSRGQYLSVHGWCYRLDDACVRDLELCINNKDEVENVYMYATTVVKSKSSFLGRAHT